MEEKIKKFEAQIDKLTKIAKKYKAEVADDEDLKKLKKKGDDDDLEAAKDDDEYDEEEDEEKTAMAEDEEDEEEEKKKMKEMKAELIQLRAAVKKPLIDQLAAVYEGVVSDEEMKKLRAEWEKTPYQKLQFIANVIKPFTNITIRDLKTEKYPVWADNTTQSAQTGYSASTLKEKLFKEFDEVFN